MSGLVSSSFLFSISLLTGEARGTSYIINNSIVNLLTNDLQYTICIQLQLASDSGCIISHENLAITATMSSIPEVGKQESGKQVSGQGKVERMRLGKRRVIQYDIVIGRSFHELQVYIFTEQRSGYPQKTTSDFS